MHGMGYPDDGKSEKPIEDSETNDQQQQKVAGEKSMSQFKHSTKRSSLSQCRIRLFVLFRPSADWLRSPYIRKRNLLQLVY